MMITKLFIESFPGVKSRNCLIETIIANGITYKVMLGYDTPEEVIQMVSPTSGVVIARNTSSQSRTATVQHYLERLHQMYDLTDASDLFTFDADYRNVLTC